MNEVLIPCKKCEYCRLYLSYRKHSSNTLQGFAAQGITYEMRVKDAIENATKYCLQNPDRENF